MLNWLLDLDVYTNVLDMTFESHFALFALVTIASALGLSFAYDNVAFNNKVK